MQQPIKISGVHMARLKRHAEAAEPFESCALLLGRGRTVADVVFADNADPHPERFFTIPTVQLVSAYKAAESRGQEIVGIFHSHPSSGAHPSDTDIEFMKMNPVVWVIYSGADKAMRAYCSGSDGGRPADVKITQSRE